MYPIVLIPLDSMYKCIGIFYLVMPVLYGGYGNYIIPVYSSTSEVGFPRVNGLSLLLLVPVSVSYLLVSIGTEFPGGTG